MQDFVGDDPDPHVGHVSHLLPQGRICILIKYLAQAILAQAILGGEHDRAQAMEPMREGRSRSALQDRDDHVELRHSFHAQSGQSKRCT